ncbi:MAG: DUF2905 domain-containing protein [Chloroflexi bacterium]|nr:DUF2905 domain-containing protein [Chloroflexota bacterium]
MDLNSSGRVIMLLGVALLVLGGLVVILSRVPILKHLGHLPGDIHIQRGNFACFFPITTMIVISILFSLALTLIVRLLNR